MAEFEYRLPAEQTSLAGLKRGPQNLPAAHHETREKIEEMSKTISEIAEIIKAAHDSPDEDPLKQISDKIDRLAEQNKLLVQVLTELTTMLKTLQPRTTPPPPGLPSARPISYQRTR